MQTLPIELFAQNMPAIETLLAELVRIESPSTDKAAVDRMGARLIQEVERLGGQIQIFPNASVGNNIACKWGHGPGDILLLAHMDTVHEHGALARQPFRLEEGKWLGPGVLDMKGSIVMLLTILRLFQENQAWPARPLTILFTSDEETGSEFSRAVIEDHARQAALALCLEPALASGAIKTARKGTGDIELRVTGVAAHAGIDHAAGRNAIEELAHHILAAQKLTHYEVGTTVNAGIIQGGTRANVVPEHAYAQIDFRVTVMEEFHRLERWVAGLQPVLEGTKIEPIITLNRPPMPHDDAMQHTFEKASAIAAALGITLHKGSTGGGSDANFVAPLGVPVLDGLGPVGDGAHSPREFAWVDSFAERSALLAALLLNW